MHAVDSQNLSKPRGARELVMAAGFTTYDISSTGTGFHFGCHLGWAEYLYSGEWQIGGCPTGKRIGTGIESLLALLNMTPQQQAALVREILERRNIARAYEDPEGINPVHLWLYRAVNRGADLHDLERIEREVFDGKRGLLHILARAVTTSTEDTAALEQAISTLIDAENRSGAKLFDINRFDCAGMSPLHYAVEYPKSNVVQLLLEAGADPDAVSDNMENKSAHDLAITLGRPDLVQVFDTWKARQAVAMTLRQHRLLEHA